MNTLNPPSTSSGHESRTLITGACALLGGGGKWPWEVDTNAVVSTGVSHQEGRLQHPHQQSSTRPGLEVYDDHIIQLVSLPVSRSLPHSKFNR